MKAVILGCGPAGLLAAHACAMQDMEVVIYSKKVPSYITGAMFIHEPIPPWCDPDKPDAMIKFIKRGSAKGYAKKVYGSGNAPTSWRNYDEGERPGWSMLDLYEKLWDLYHFQIVECDLAKTPQLSRIEQQPYDLHVSTVPAPILCQQPGNHQFDLKTIWIKNGNDLNTIERNTVVYNGDAKSPWYRASNLFGDVSFEYGNPVPSARLIKKPLHTNCDCRPKWTRVGRYGRWERGVLAHTAFFDTYALHSV